MKKVFISLGIILVIAGIVVVGVFGGAKGFTDWRDFRLHDLSKADETLRDFDVEELQGLSKIEVQAEQFCVYVVESSDAEKVSVKAMSKLPDGVEISVDYDSDNKVLKVTQKLENSKHLWLKIWNAEYLKYFAVIELPKIDAFSDVEFTAHTKHGALIVDGEVIY